MKHSTAPQHQKTEQGHVKPRRHKDAPWLLPMSVLDYSSIFKRAPGNSSRFIGDIKFA